MGENKSINIKEVISFVIANISLWMMFLFVGALISIAILEIIDFIKYIMNHKKK